MAIPKLAAFLESLRDSGLLEPAQIDELARSPHSEGADAVPLAKELLRRGLLTKFQVNQIAAGRGKELTVGPYRLLDRLGEGAMGQVYKAHHAVMNRTVALKLIRKEWLANANAVARFYKEVQAAAQLIHPNIVLAYDAGQAGPTHYFAMEYIEGIDLSRLVQQSGPLAVGQACEYIRQAALGLHHAFGRGMVHRDIKPHNLLVARTAEDPEGSAGSAVKILDMGLARLQSSTVKDHALTQTGTVVGTPDFIAPEQALSSRDADIRSDIYSLGCTLYYLLAGKAPHHGTSLTEVLLKHQLHEPTPIEEIRKDVPAGVRSVLKKMLAKQPADRYQAPAQIAEALAPFASLKFTAPAIPRAKPTREAVLSELESSGSVDWSPAKSTSRSRSGSRTEVVSQSRPGLARKLRRLKKKNPALLYGVGAGFVLLLGIAFVTPVIMKLRPRSTPEVADPSQVPSQIAVASAAGKAGAGEEKNQPANQQDRADPMPAEAKDRIVAEGGRGAARQREAPVVVRAPIPPRFNEMPGTREEDILKRFPHIHQSLWQMGVSPDGKRAVTLGSEKTMCLWDVENGKRLKEFKWPLDSCGQIAVLPDGKQALVLLGQNGVQLLDLDKEQLIGSIVKDQRSQITDIALSGDGRSFLAAQHDGLHLYNFQTGRLVKKMAFDSGSWMGRVLWSKDERIAVSTGGFLRVWDVQKGKEMVALDGAIQNVGAMALSADARTLLTANMQENMIHVWDLKSGQEIRAFPLTQVDQSDDGKHVDVIAFGPAPNQAMVHSAASIWFLDVENGQVTGKLGRNGTSNVIGHVAPLPADKLLCTNGRGDLVLRKWPDPKSLAKEQEAKKRLLCRLQGSQPGFVTNFAFTADSQRLFSSWHERRVVTWELPSGRLLKEFANEISFYRSTACADNKRVVSLGEDNRVRIWNLETGQTIQTLPAAFAGASFSADGARLLAIRPENGSLQVVDLEKGKVIKECPGSAAHSGKWSRDGGRALMAIAGGDQQRGMGFFTLVDITKMEVLRRFIQEGRLTGFDISPDGRQAIAGADGQIMRLWDLDEGRELGRFEGTVEQLVSIVYSVDGRLAFSGSSQGIVQVWDVSSRREVQRFHDTQSMIEQLAVSSDGKLLAASAHQNITVWNIADIKP